MYLVSVPISVPISKKKKFYLNLNQYRNTHHHSLARAKVNFHEIVAPTLGHLPKFKTVDLVYTLFTGTEQLCDTSNICSIVDKFFSDVLVSCKKIEDDNRKIVLSVRFCWGGVDKFDPRVEVSITPGEVSSGTPATDHNPEERKMQISINQAEIEIAIEKHIRERTVVAEHEMVRIDLKATRGPEGYQAVIDIVEKAATPTKKASVSATGHASSTKSTGVKEAVRAARTPKAIVPDEPEVVEETPVTESTATARHEVTSASAEPETVEPLEVNEAEPVMSDDTVQSEEPPAKPRQSLFRNLNEPHNA
jgi:hypothetical protein